MVGPRSAAQDASRHENLISCGRRGARRRPARDDVNPSRDRRCAKTVARRRHARMAAPAVAPGIVGFRLVEGAGGCLAAEHEHPPLKHRRRDAAARRGQRSALLPATGCGIIGLVRRQIARIVAVDAAAYGVEASVQRGGRQVSRAVGT